MILWLYWMEEMYAALKDWLEQNRHISAVIRDHASVYAKAVEEVLPDGMQIADCFSSSTKRNGS